MRHGPGFISPYRNLSCLANICCLLPVVGRVDGDYWWLTNWAGKVQFWVSCPVRVRWFLVRRFPNFTLKWFLIRHVGFKPSTRGILEAILHLEREEGFENLTKDSRISPLTNHTMAAGVNTCILSRRSYTPMRTIHVLQISNANLWVTDTKNPTLGLRLILPSQSSRVFIHLPQSKSLSIMRNGINIYAAMRSCAKTQPQSLSRVKHNLVFT